MAEQTKALELAHGAFDVMQADGPSALVARYEEFFAPELEFRSALVGEVEGGRTYVGRDGFERYWHDFDTSFDSFELADGTFTEGPPGTVVIETAVRVTGSGSGVSLERGVVYVFRFDGVRMYKGRTFFELDEARRYAEEGS